MPHLPSLVLPNAFTFIVEATNPALPGRTWRNTWDIHQTGSSPNPTDAIITDILQFHRSNLRTDAYISASMLRAWSQGPQPFAIRPNIWEETYSAGALVGQKTAILPTGYGSEQGGVLSTPGTIVLFCKRLTTARNRPTSLFLRGLLDQADYWAYTGGPPELLNTSAVTAAKFAAIKAAQLGPHLNPAADPRIIIVHVGNHHVGPPFESDVTEVAFVGPSQNKQTRKNPR